VCDYYYEANAWQDPGIMRFCYVNEVVIEKTAFDMGTSLNGGDATTELCVWSTNQTGPTCR
jgi:hypothetical protein